MIKRYQFSLWLLGLLVVGLILRTYHLDTLPISMHRDEVAIGYNAYSLLKTGRDEHGVGPWPIAFTSFGDFKLPGMVYVTAIGVKIGGLNPQSVRLPNAVLASVLIVVVYGLVLELFGDKKQALLTSGLVTFSIWHTFLARTIYEPIGALTLSTLGLLLFIKARQNHWWLWPAILALGISFFFYNLPLLLMPMLIMSGLIIFRNDYLAAFKKHKLLMLLASLLMSSVMVASLVIQSRVTGGKLSTNSDR